MIKVASFNCNGFQSNFEYIKLLMKKYDIICVQETLLFETCNEVLGDLSPDFGYYYQSATRTSSIVGRSSGGLVTYFANTISAKVKNLYCSNRMLCTSVTLNGDDEYIFVNCYFPCDYNNNNSLVEYRETLAELQSF